MWMSTYVEQIQKHLHEEYDGVEPNCKFPPFLYETLALLILQIKDKAILSESFIHKAFIQYCLLNKRVPYRYVQI